MNSTNWNVTGILLVSLLASGPIARTQQALKPTLAFTQPPLVANYAEGLYNEYATATSGAISFSVETLESGDMTALAGKPFNTLITVPEYRILADQTGTILSNPRFAVPEDPAYGQRNMEDQADRFADFGLPLEDGSYRLLQVSATIGGDQRSHEALEFCWSGLDHCAVLDPVVDYLQTKVETRLRLKAEGWGPRVTYLTQPANATTSRQPASDATSEAKGTCGLASHPKDYGLTYTWAHYDATGKDIYGITVWTLSLGEQQAGITCDTSCKPQPFALSNTSSGSGWPGYHFGHDNKGVTGTTGSTSRTIAQTDGDVAFVGSASVSVTVEGKGDGISLKWDLSSAAYSNGGTYTDSCAYF